MKFEPNGIYEIRIEGILDDQWTDWFDGFDILADADGNSTLVGLVADQAALHGLLDKVRDLGMTLLSVTPRKR
jgi:hypothetical protein